MVEDLRKSLDKKGTLIHRHFIMSPAVMTVAKKENLFDEKDIRALSELEENEDRINLMLDMIRGRGYEFYRQFLAVLRISGHNALADKLDPTVAEKKTVTFNPIQPIRSKVPSMYDSESMSSSSSSSVSSNSSSSSNSSDDYRRSRRTRRKEKKQSNQAQDDNAGMFGEIPDFQLPEMISSDTPRLGEAKAHAHASKSLDNLYLHYDTAKVHYRRRLDHLRHQEQQLRASLLLNGQEQRKCQRNLDVVDTIKRQLAFVNDKQMIIRKNDLGKSQEQVQDLIRSEESNELYSGSNTSRIVSKRDLQLHKWKY